MISDLGKTMLELSNQYNRVDEEISRLCTKIGLLTQERFILETAMKELVHETNYYGSGAFKNKSLFAR